MHAMTEQESQAARDQGSDGLAPWIATGWAALIFLGAGSVLADRWMPADTAMAALASAPAEAPVAAPSGSSAAPSH